MMKVGLIGLGAMGWGIATNLAKADLLTAVYNRTTNKAEQFTEQWKVPHYSSVKQLAKKVDCLFICISTDTDVLQVINEISATIQPDSIVVDMSTVSNDTAQQADFILSKQQVSFLDAPVLGGVEGAKHGNLSIMVGGNKNTLDKITFILKTISKNITYMGDVGTGQSTKAVNQIMAVGINQAVTDALAFAKKQNLPMEQVIDVISNGAANNWFLQHRGQSMTNYSFTTGFKCRLHYKDLLICQKMAEKNHQSLDSINKTIEDYQKLIKMGYGDEDISALYRLKTN